MRFEKVQIGDCTLYRGDCADVLSIIGTVDCVITDPPYGLGELKGTTSKFDPAQLKPEQTDLLV